MNNQRLDKLLAWLSTGSIAIALGGFLLVCGWLVPLLTGEPAVYHRARVFVDPQIALGGGLLLIVTGLFFIIRAVIGKLRSRD